MRNDRCLAEDLHLFSDCSETPGRSGDEVTHLYDILTFLNIFNQRTFLKVSRHNRDTWYLPYAIHYSTGFKE